jgi:uncharacterized protein
VAFVGERFPLNAAENAGSTPDALLVFVRAPRLGEVKTRLARDLGEARALAIYRRLAEHTLAEAAAVRGVELRVHHAPADAGDEVRSWLGEGPVYLPQAEGDLGARMHAAFAAAFASGARRVVIVGSDLPALSAGLLRRAFAALEASRAVIGPARDGGYYLLGLAEPVPELFDGVAWSTPQVFAATLERLRSAGIEPVRLEVLADVDRAADLPAGWGS